MKRLIALTSFAFAVAFAGRTLADGVLTGPLAKKLGERPPAISAGGTSANEIKAKIRSGEIKRVTPIAIPDGVELIANVEYGKGGNRPRLLDLYKPKQVAKVVPGLIFVHGGSWSGGSRKIYGYYCEKMAKLGYVAATVDYRLSGEAPFPAAIQDVKCAIRWLRANAARYGVDPGKIGLVGGSAGGHLVLLAAYANTDDPELEGTGGNNGVSSRVQAVVDLYGPVLLKGRRSAAVVKFMGGKSSDEAPELYAKASPILHLTKDAPPTLIIHGTVDELVSISASDSLAAKLGELGVAYLYDRQEGWHHAMDQVQEVNDRCVWLMERFLAQVLPLQK